MALNEADTCCLYVTPKLQVAGWDTSPHSLNEQKVFTDGRIFAAGGTVTKGPQKRADYLLRYTRDFSIAVVEAKPEDATAGSGLQQAKDYAEILGLKFAYATNGHEIIEFDYITGAETVLLGYPTPAQLWQRLRGNAGLTEEKAQQLLTASLLSDSIAPRYYQEIAINRTVQAILTGKQRILLTMATGTGKTVVAC